MKTITYEEFEKVELRSGTIAKVEEFPRAKKPAFKVWADFGPEIGVLQTSAQITKHYNPEMLIGKSIVGLAKRKSLVNFQLVNQIIEYIQLTRENGFDEHIMIFYSLISYFMDGKILTEGLSNSLKYFEENIRLQKDKYPIVDCIKVMITS